MKKLPIGIQTFSTIIDDNYCYVNKTPLVAKLADQSRFYFLSRPRRFGKSLLVDTIADAFLGKKKLFKGLFLENNWDWNKTHPVIRIDFAQGPHLRFVLLTGVSKFSKVSLFSGLNNLQDISLDKRYGTLCGYTQEELESVFHNYLTNVDLDLLKRWYNGYSFLSQPVYNQKKYHKKYPGKDTWLIGIEFSKEGRNITRFEWERLCG